MTKRQAALVIGSLLHDIWKVVYRSGDGRDYSESGYYFVKENAGIEDRDILDCVRFHNVKALSTSGISVDSPAYLAYFADNIASAADRRMEAGSEEDFDKTVPLSSIFNILNGNNENLHYRQALLDSEGEINYPVSEDAKPHDDFWRKIAGNVEDCFKNIEFSEAYINSLLAVLEVNLSYIPASTSKSRLSDISLYDHAKLTAAVALCMEQYFDEKSISDYREKVLQKADETYAEKMFLLYSMDISGIQKFIYTITSEDALKGLRARSFYLEILMEHIVDELLDLLGLCRANLIYCGGGHCYMLLPGTESCVRKLNDYEASVNDWFMEKFGTALYIAGGAASCSANELKNDPEGSYGKLYSQISEKISFKKAHRYSWENIKSLNSSDNNQGRECRICKRSETLDERGRCSICAALERFSGDVLYSSFFVVSSRPQQDSLPLPSNRYLTAFDNETKLKAFMKSGDYVRCYTKNKDYTGKLLSTHLWVGSYTTGAAFEDLAKKAKEAGAIARIGVMRADIDDLGAAFAKGFIKDKSSRYMSLSRTAVLSRRLSLFFKCYINKFLTDRNANAVIVYSGGDDIFLVGAWNEIVYIFSDLRAEFRRFTQGTLTLSGGVGIYSPRYPIHVMAEEVGRLEKSAKSVDGKNAVTLFDPEFTFDWDSFSSGILDGKYSIIKTFFDATKDYGKSFLYHIAEFLRDSGEKINFVRLIYLLSRMEPSKDSDESTKNAYSRFAQNMHKWIKSKKDRREAEFAIYLYIYMTREMNTNEEDTDE